MNKTRSTGQERETERKRKKIGGKMDRESGGGDVKERVREIQRETALRRFCVCVMRREIRCRFFFPTTTATEMEVRIDRKVSVRLHIYEQ